MELPDERIEEELLDPPYSLIPLPEPWVDAEEGERLNEWFYGTEPHEYFGTRLDLLILYAAKPSLRDDFSSEELRYRGLKVGPTTPVEEESDEVREKRHHAFVLTETATLLHHLGETLLRFYFAHSPGTDGKVAACPWLEVAGELSVGAFKERVKARFDGQPLDDTRRSEIATTFYYSRGVLESNEPDSERVNRSVEEIENWLQHFAQWFLADANMFNALKHGLAVQAGESAVSLGKEAEILSQDGPSILFLEQVGPERLWRYKTRWVEPDYLITEAIFALRLLNQIHTVGRARYLDDRDDLKLSFYDHATLDKIRQGQLAKGEKARFVLTNFTISLDYRYPYQPPLTCSSCGRAPAETERPFKTWRAKYRVGDAALPVCPKCATAFERTAASGAERTGP